MIEQGHLTDEVLERYRSKALTPDDLVLMMMHVAECSDCRRRLQSPGDGGRLKQSFAPEHLTFDELHSLVEGRGAAPEESLQHLESCTVCAAELADLIAFRNEPKTAATGPARIWNFDVRVPAAVLAVLMLSFAAWRYLTPRETAPQ